MAALSVRPELEAIVLAAGMGVRFGGGKLLAPYKDGVLIDGAIKAALAAPVRRVVLVTGHDEARVAAAARSAASQTVQERLCVVHAHNYMEGMAASLSTGVGALSHGIDGAFVFLGDMPETPVHVAALLMDAIGERAAAAPIFKGCRGHPVLFAARLFPSLRRLSGDQGASALLSTLGDDLVLIDVEDAGVLFDVDHPSEITPWR